MLKRKYTLEELQEMFNEVATEVLIEDREAMEEVLKNEECSSKVKEFVLGESLKNQLIVARINAKLFNRER